MAAKRRRKETFSRRDAADYLKSEGDMVAYSKQRLEKLLMILRALLRNRRHRPARGMVQLAGHGETREV